MVGAPGDKYEREADHMADTVMAMSEAADQSSDVRTGAGGTGGDSVSLSLANSHLNSDPTSCTPSASPASPTPLSPETVQQKPHVTQLPDVQLLPGLYLQRQAVLEAETPTQAGNAVPLDKHRLKQYEKEAGVDATGALEEGKKHFGGEAQKGFRETESANLADTQSAQTDAIASSNQDMFTTREEEFTNVQATQQEAQIQDESDRGRVTQEIQAIYDETKINVNGILGRMDARVNAEFTATDKRAKAVLNAARNSFSKLGNKIITANATPYISPGWR